MHYLTLLLLVVGLASPAWALTPTNDWKTLQGSTRNSLTNGSCLKFEFTSTTVDDSKWIFVVGHDIDIGFEPDVSGTAITAKVDLKWAERPDGDGDGTDDDSASNYFKWDTDGDGIVDNSTLDHASDMKKGLAGVRLAGWLGVEINTLPGAGDTASVLVCSH